MIPRTTPCVRARIVWAASYIAFAVAVAFFGGEDAFLAAVGAGVLGMWGGKMCQGCDACERSFYPFGEPGWPNETQPTPEEIIEQDATITRDALLDEDDR